MYEAEQDEHCEVFSTRTAPLLLMVVEMMAMVLVVLAVVVVVVVTVAAAGAAAVAAAPAEEVLRRPRFRDADDGINVTTGLFNLFGDTDIALSLVPSTTLFHP
ncbi:unnamed protein product [Enterobius vermicularis]|uniref:Secreted protein n=1 Tax=Enterobius vermicularis TaxID=51028 RepID=A0A0N4V7Q2_ENTVE|nr:unnamed protein product [Enterobius vermicularis]